MQQHMTDTKETKARKFYICQGYNTEKWVSWLLGRKKERSLKLVNMLTNLGLNKKKKTCKM